jgi:polar amino acid transport system ATP-binding protein
MMSALVQIHQIHKSFGEIAVLRGIDLQVREHEVVCLIGGSGCGKSTLLRCINGLETVTSGDISVDGENVTGRGADLNQVRRDVGIVFQNYNLFPHMTVMDNVTLAPRRVLRQSRAEAENRGRLLLERIGLLAKADEFPDRLSGGQQQRAAIARALAMGPRVLLLDEITSALDPELVGEVLAIVRELADEGMTMILATHEMAFARQVADKICYLFEGRILESGPPEQLFSDPREQRTRAFLKRSLAGLLPPP